MLVQGAINIIKIQFWVHESTRCAWLTNVVNFHSRDIRQEPLNAKAYLNNSFQNRYFFRRRCQKLFLSKYISRSFSEFLGNNV